MHHQTGEFLPRTSRNCSVSLENVNLSFLDDGEVIYITNEQDEHRDQSSKKINFVVQDQQAPVSPTTIASTCSADSNLSDLSKDDDKLTLFCWVLNVSGHPFSIDIGKSVTVGHLKRVIKKKNEHTFGDVEAHTLGLWKLSSPIPSEEIGTKLRDVQSPRGISGCVKLNAIDELSEHFPPTPRKHLHIIVEVPPRPSRKRDGEAKKHTMTRRTWTVYGAITQDEVNTRYYVDPGAQNETSLCLNTVSDGTYLLLTGPRASGKSTRLFWLQRKLKAMGYWALYITFEDLLYQSSIEDFWKSFSKAVDRAIAACGRGSPIGLTTPISSRADLKSYFFKDSWDRNVVLLLDEFSCLYQAKDDVRNDCLVAFRGLKQNRESHAVKCLIAAGTFSIVYLSPTSGIPPFNVADIVQCPFFTIDETRKLFLEFAKDLGFSIDNSIVEDVWAKSNGHPGMVCLCGRTIYNNMQKLFCSQSQTISYDHWKRFPAEELYVAMSRYNAFHSLSRAEAASSVNLLRSKFAGFLGDVTLTDNKAKEDAVTLTSEGVLVRPNLAIACYRMASPLVDELIRNQLIPARFPKAPSSPLPLQHTGDVDVLRVLIESLKFFDQALILNASYCSYKIPKVKIPGPYGRHVPRESVYDTELMRILANWLRKYEWSVNGQWRSEDNLKRPEYSDIVLKKGRRTIVLELLATGEPSSVESHIRKTLEYAALLSADEAWVVHFTRQENYHPIWQSDTDINVVHFAHDPGFTNVVMSARWRDCAGVIQEEVRTLTL